MTRTGQSTAPRRSTSRKPGAAPRRSTSGKPRAARKAPLARPPETSRRLSRRPSRRTAVLLAGVCLAVVAALVAGVVTMTGHRTGDEVASVDGHPVTRDELLFHMRRLAPTVQNELRNRYHLKGAIDWTEKAGDRTALQRLETRALDEIRQDKTTYVLAKEQGLVDSVDYEDFLADLAKENQSRAGAVAAGQTVYGVTEFTPEEYYTRRLTELTTGLEKRLSKGAGDPLHVTDAEVRKAFDADRDDWSANATTYRYTQVVVPVPAGAAADYGARLQRRVTTAKDLGAVAAAEPGAELTNGTYDGSSSTGVNVHDQDLMAVLGKLRPGQISAPVTALGQITYYELDSKKVDEDKAFTAYRQRIQQSLVEEKFTQYLQRRVKSSDLQVDTSAVDAIKAKDLQR